MFHKQKKPQKTYLIQSYYGMFIEHMFQSRQHTDFFV